MEPIVRAGLIYFHQPRFHLKPGTDGGGYIRDIAAPDHVSLHCALDARTRSGSSGQGLYTLPPGKGQA